MNEKSQEILILLNKYHGDSQHFCTTRHLPRLILDCSGVILLQYIMLTNSSIIIA